jgi:hypothetical protein
MTFTQTSDPTIRGHVENWQRLEVDEQLALFWFIYEEMGGAVTPAAPGASTVSPEIAQGLFQQVEQLSLDEQLQVQRDLINRRDTLISRQYGSLSETTKLLFWYLLAEGMNNSTIIPFPEDYQLSTDAENLLNQITELNFEQQITLFRDYVAPMGAEPRPGAEI